MAVAVLPQALPLWPQLVVGAVAAAGPQEERARHLEVAVAVEEAVIQRQTPTELQAAAAVAAEAAQQINEPQQAAAAAVQMSAASPATPSWHCSLTV